MIRDLSDPRAADIVERHRIYWQNGGWPRPLFHVFPTYSLADTPHPYYLEPASLDVSVWKEQVERSYDQSGLLADDLIRMVGTGITSEALVGCRIAVRNGTHWAEPCFQNWDQFTHYDVKKTAWFHTLMDNTKRAVDALDPSKYPFCCMAFRGAVDMAEAVMKGEHLCIAVYESPRELKEMLSRITDIIIETALAHSALLPSHHGGFFNSYGIWTPGRTVTFTVDGACLFSPACYEEFFLPHDIRLCEAFETPFVHLHAAARQHFLSWAAIPNLGLQCVIDQAWLPQTESNRPIGPQLDELLSLFATLRQKKSLMLYGYWEENQIDRAMTALPTGGMAIVGMVRDPDATHRRYGIGSG